MVRKQNHRGCRRRHQANSWSRPRSAATWAGAGRMFSVMEQTPCLKVPRSLPSGQCSTHGKFQPPQADRSFSKRLGLISHSARPTTTWTSGTRIRVLVPVLLARVVRFAKVYGRAIASGKVGFDGIMESYSVLKDAFLTHGLESASRRIDCLSRFRQALLVCLWLIMSGAG